MELIALYTATIEVEWLHKFLIDLRVVENPVSTIFMNCDDQTIIIKMNSSKDYMKSTRHVNHS
jgi:hypothetical protein